MPSLRHREPTIIPRAHPIHDSIFGDDIFDDDVADIEIDDTPQYASRGLVNSGGVAAAPEAFEPMRQLGDTDQGDRQPDSRRRR
jgi:hypothetical protein